MNRKWQSFFFNHLVRPPVLVISFMVKEIYWITYGWWGEKRFNEKNRLRLEDEIKDRFCFLFSEHSARLVRNGEIDPLAKLGWPVVRLTTEGVLLRFAEWRDTRQVHIASENAPNEWYELTKLLEAIDPTQPKKTIVVFRDAANILQQSFEQLKRVLSPTIDSQVKEHILRDREYDMAATRQLQNEINRRLYGS